MKGCEIKRSTVIKNILVFLTGLLPPLLVVPGKIMGKNAFTLYREPKLYLIGALAWLLFTVGEAKKSAVVKGLMVLCFISLLSLLWAPVKEAVFYEAFQYINLAVLASVLAHYFRQRQARLFFLYGLLVSMAIAVFIGLCQWRGIRFPQLFPVGIPYPSTFGARHSAGLAVCGTIFLTVAPLSYFLKKERYVALLFLIVLFSLQLFYILILGSRTSYFGILMGGLATGAIGARYFRFIPKKFIIYGIMLLLLASGFATICFYKNGYVQNRVNKTLVFFRNPSLFFQSERWVWWSNSFQMLKENPLGVGAGNWGFLYPVYRKSGKHVYYTGHTQVRRTHNDYLQLLCELGPVGVFILLFLLFKSLKWSWQVYEKNGSLEAAFLLVQIAAWTGLMCFDYPFEMPFQRFLLVMAMLLAEGVYNESLA